MPAALNVVMLERKCLDCGVLKPLADFHRSRAKSNGHSSYCKTCDSARCKARYKSEEIEIRQQLKNQGLKKCPRCAEVKPLGDYYRVSRLSNGRAAFCKECELINRRETYKITKVREGRKSSQYKSAYGITLAEAREMLRQQHGLCANRGCGKAISFDIVGNAAPYRRGSSEPRKYANSALIDHCHKTGKIRGILCHKCNLFAGQVENYRNHFLGILEYLARTS